MTEISIHLVETRDLSPIEGFGPKRVVWLKKKILDEGVWTVPLKVENTHKLVMDGHHRFEVAKALGLRFVPAELFSYDDVEVYSLRKSIVVTPEVILSNAKNEVIFPYKTAKHRFPDTKMTFEGIPLDELR